MAQVQFWTTYSPQKICWEITTCENNGNHGDSNWQNHLPLIRKTLKQLKSAGITGIRLVLIPNDFSTDGNTFTFKPLETMLELCQKESLLVDFCLGPIQYPFYPSIRLPNKILEQIVTSQTVTKNSTLHDYGLRFLTEQVKLYGKDKRIRGWYIGNEWPDAGDVEGKQHLRVRISRDFMVSCIKIVRKYSKKPIHLNTNIDVAYPLRQKITFHSLLNTIGTAGGLGFDVYPSQESWKKAPMLMLKRFFFPFPRSFQKIMQVFTKPKLFFAEIEAQPWGNGRSWHAIITAESNPEEKVLQYTRNSLPEHVNKRLRHCSVSEISLWGADFWLASNHMGVVWPLKQIKELRYKLY